MSAIFTTIGSTLASVAKPLIATAARVPGARKLALAAAGAVVLAGGAAAQAHEHGRVEVDVRLGAPVRYEKVYETREVKVWVPAVYRTVVDHVYREPVYQTVCEKVFVPEVSEVREVRRFDRGRVCVTRERVIVVPAHYEDRNCQKLVCAGHYEDVTRQELVCDGHYECHTERVCVGERRELSPVEIIHPLLHIR